MVVQLIAANNKMVCFATERQQMSLFYLMVLINGHTISKNTYYNEDSDDIVDSFNDLDNTKEDKKKHDRIHHNYRREEKKDTTKAIQAKVNDKSKGNLVRVTTKVLKLALPTVHNEKNTKGKHFWNKFHNSAKEKKHNNVEVGLCKRRIPKIGKHKYYESRHNIHKSHNHVTSENTQILDKFKNVQNYYYTERTDIRKRELPGAQILNISSIETTTDGSIYLRSPDNLKVKLSTDKSDGQVTLRSIKTSLPFIKTKNITEALAEITTQLSSLKETYGLTNNEMNPSSLITQNFLHSKDNMPYLLLLTTTDHEFNGTAQLEELLNEIKIKAIKMMTEQHPSVTDIITNTVIESTFEADPILTHLSVTPSHTLLTSNLSADSYENIVVSYTEPTHIIGTRSVQEDVYTIVRTVEDLLQDKVKKVYKKLKKKVSTDFHHEVQHAKKKTTKAIHKISESVATKTKPTVKPHIKKVTITPKNLSTLKHLRHVKANKHKTTEASTNDDYVMLTLYEQILSKARQNNIMNILTTSVPGYYDKGHLNKKRDISKDYAKVYEDIMTEDYSVSGTKTDTSNTYVYSTETPEDTSFEGLSNKICFNEFVNGYKYYLKFQKEQGNQNFSNLVKYQAHKHHNVEDIGKYILNKIPQVSLSRSKRYEDDDNMDDQEASTKSDDSWFKKHFYFFIDRDPPKRFHTSQTVTLKSPITYDSKTERSSTSITSLSKTQELDESEYNFVESDVNLDKLTDSLNDQKSKESNPSHIEESTEPNYSFQTNNENPAIYQLGPRNINDELDRRKRNYNTKNVEFEDNPVLMKTTQQRVIDSKNKKYGYVDVNLIPRPTAIVKLRDNKRKKNRIKNFFNRFHLPKDKKHEKVKRDIRSQRFNPLKSLKNIFTLRTSQSVPFTRDAESRDWEMMTTHIDTFKPVEYNKVLTIDEISRQIPNITADIALESSIEKPQPDTYIKELQDFIIDYPPTTTFVYKVPELATSMESSANPSTSIVHKKKARKKKVKTTKKLLTTTRTYYENPLIPENVSSTSINQIIETTKNLLFDENLLLPDDVEGTSVNKMIEITKKLLAEENLLLKTEYIGSTGINKLIESTSFNFNKNAPVTLYSGAQSPLDNIKNELKDIEMTISGPVSSTIFSPTKKKTHLVSHRIYVPPHLRQTTNKVPLHDVTFHTQNTKVAKFPLETQYKHDTNLKITPIKAKRNTNSKCNLKNWSNKLKRYAKTVKPDSKIFNGYAKQDDNKPYPDYFNDLLTWHGDVLNNEKVTSKVWDLIKKVQNVPDPVTPSMADMEKELMQIKEYIRYNDYISTTKKKSLQSGLEAKKEKMRSNPTTFEEIIGTAASKDDELAQGSNIIIKGETKYLHVFRDPNNLIKYSETANMINDFNKMHPKLPSMLFNIDDKLSVKRRGNFWNNNIGAIKETGKTGNDSSVIYLDTTLLSYDDGPDFLTEKPKARKLFKNSLNYTQKKSKNTTAKPITKINQSPQQYFSTPLPMKMNDFDKFLKDNEIDVPSVTKPLAGVPELLDLKPKSGAANEKIHPKMLKAKNDKIKDGTVKTAYWSKYDHINGIYVNEPEEMIQDVIREDDYGEISYVDANHKLEKRYNKLISSRFCTSEPDIDRPIKKFKNRLLKKKTPGILDMRYPVTFSTNNGIGKDVELTIINMDDADDKTEAKFRDVNEVTKLNIDKPNSKTQNDKSSETNKVKDTKPKTFKTNNLVANNISDKDVVLIDNTPQIQDSYLTTSFERLIGTDLLNKLHRKSHHHKRVRISSHSYKYDVIYDDNKKNKRNLHQRKSSTAAVDYTDDESPYNTLESLIHAIRKFYRVEKHLNIVHAVEAVEDFTRPNVMIYIELPTYYMPYTGPTEPVVIRKPKSIWNDFVLKYLSGLALVELLSKFGLIKVYDVHLNYTDGLDKTVNTCKVFSDAEIIARTDYMIKLQNRERRRRNRQVTPKPESEVLMKPVELGWIRPNSRKKRRLKLFSNIKEKLRHLLGKKNRHSTTKIKKLKGKSKTHFKPTTSKNPKREDQEEINAETNVLKEIPLEYDFDLDKFIMGKMKTSRNFQLSPDQLLIDESTTNALSKPDLYFETPKHVNEIIEPTKQMEMDLEPIFPKKLENNDIINNMVNTENPINKIDEMKVGKRDITTPESYTARDVAAIEVIVDLVKNTICDDVEAPRKDFYHNIALSSNSSTPTMPDNIIKPATNVIQVRIAIPYNFSVDKKRSINSLNFKKVFSAKMYKPVDLEYQVQSFGDTTEASNPPSIDLYKSSPKMYLLVDASALSKENYASNTQKGDKDYSKVNFRQVEATKVFEQKTETTTPTSNVCKVTLSKDFVAAVNKHLIQLYQNLTNGTATKHVRARNTESFIPTNSNVNSTTIFRRHINWDGIKKYFGHDRVCHCKCKANRTMCRACAASDAVITELIFEFDNLANYMKEHCTEIQTYFWMNPSGGKKLRDSVHRVDQTLRNYFKRVKGQCQGRTCKTFSTCIDKRSVVKIQKFPEMYIGMPLIYDLEKLADDILIASTLNMSCNKNLISHEKKMVNVIESCTEQPQSHDKLDLQAPSKVKPQVKNVYSLDNINVNIICSRKAPTDLFVLTQTDTVTTTTPLLTQGNFYSKRLSYNNEFDTPQIKKEKSVVKTLFSKYRPRKLNFGKLFTYHYNVTSEPYKNYHKRQTQVESPLVSDAGGIFWQDYIKDKESQSRVVRDSTEINKVGGTTVSNSPYETTKPTVSNTPPQSSTENNILQPDFTGEPIETLSYNINKLFEIFQKLTDLDNFKNVSSKTYNHSKSTKMTTKTKTKPSTERKTTKIYKALEDKLNFKYRPHITKVTPNTTSKIGTSTSNVQKPSVLSNDAKDNVIQGHSNKNTPEVIAITTKTTKLYKNTLNTEETRKDTNDSSITKTVLTHKSTEREKTNNNISETLKSSTLYNTDTRYIRSLLTEIAVVNNTESSMSTTEVLKRNVDVIHDSYTTNFPTILIINDYDEYENGDKKRENDDKNIKLVPNSETTEIESSKRRSLLLSILDFERKSLNKEWIRLKKRDSNTEENIMKNMHTRSQIIKSNKSTKNYEQHDILKTTQPFKNLLEVHSPSAMPPKKGMIQMIVNKLGMTKVYKKTKANENRLQLCDVDDTLKQIINLKIQMPLKEFEKSVANITCFKYHRAPKRFVLMYKSNKRNKKITSTNITKETLNWDWIRRKRSLNSRIINANDHYVVKNNNKNEKVNDTNDKAELNHNEEQNVINLNANNKPHKSYSIGDNNKTIKLKNTVKYNKIIDVNDKDDFDTFERGEYGIYRRRKRSIINIEELRAEIQNLPFTSKPKEAYTMLGDYVVVQCADSSQNQSRTEWKTDRIDMMVYPNVAMQGHKIYIRNVNAKNQGRYTCEKGDAPEKTIDLTVITLPTYEVLITPVYFMDSDCTYEDLNSMQPLAEVMARECCPNSDVCGMRIEEPMCLRDEVNGSSYLRITLAMSISPRVDVKCSARCRRDLLVSLALLSATNAPGIASVPVLICKDDGNKTLTPASSADLRRMIITHTLRRRDFHLSKSRAISSDPDTVSLLMTCPAGYYLKTEQKICVACPSGSWSKAGDDECRRCPRAMWSDPGEGSCHLVARIVRRSDLLVCTSYGLGAVWVVALICAVTAAIRARKGKLAKAGTSVPLDPDPVVSARAQCHARPLSPSRVILPKFLRGSRSSTKVAGTHETKFGLWTEKNFPPPLPPIDFDS